MTLWKACVYLSDDERVDDIDVVEPRGVVPKHVKDELAGFVGGTRPYSDIIDGGWTAYESPVGMKYSLRLPNHRHKRFLQKEIAD